MATSPICPCSSCFNSAPQVIWVPDGVGHWQQQQQLPLQQQLQQRQQPSWPRQPRQKNFFKGHHGGGLSLLGRLRRTRSVESIASDLVGLKATAQPMAGVEETDEEKRS